jgi:hypothetical protein
VILPPVVFHAAIKGLARKNAQITNKTFYYISTPGYLGRRGSHQPSRHQDDGHSMLEKVSLLWSSFLN